MENRSWKGRGRVGLEMADAVLYEFKCSLDSLWRLLEF